MKCVGRDLCDHNGMGLLHRGNTAETWLAGWTEKGEWVCEIITPLCSFLLCQIMLLLFTLLVTRRAALNFIAITQQPFAVVAVACLLTCFPFWKTYYQTRWCRGEAVELDYTRYIGRELCGSEGHQSIFSSAIWPLEGQGFHMMEALRTHSDTQHFVGIL
jgi:hypothetical protein